MGPLDKEVLRLDALAIKRPKPSAGRSLNPPAHSDGRPLRDCSVPSPQ
jgi:hypothetical protein